MRFPRIPRHCRRRRCPALPLVDGKGGQPAVRRCAATHAHLILPTRSISRCRARAVQCVERARADASPDAMPSSICGCRRAGRAWKQSRACVGRGLDVQDRILLRRTSDYDWEGYLRAGLAIPTSFSFSRSRFETDRSTEVWRALIATMARMSGHWKRHVESLQQVLTARTEKLDAATLQRVILRLKIH